MTTLRKCGVSNFVFSSKHRNRFQRLQACVVCAALETFIIIIVIIIALKLRITRVGQTLAKVERLRGCGIDRKASVFYYTIYERRDGV